MTKTIIIAEAGVNHNGSIELAKQLIRVAKDAGADYVKFQTFKAESLVTKTSKKAVYQVRNTNNNENTQFDMLKQLELSDNVCEELNEYSKLIGIKFLSSPFDLESIDFLYNLGVDFFKIPSGESTNLPFLRKIASFKIPVVLSTGMCNLADIEAAIQVLMSGGLSRDMISVLHCNTEYPTIYSDVNLRAMCNIGNAFNVKIGYSDHTLGIEVPIAAVAMGANIIEKHFTLDCSLPGPDHKASLNPIELSKMIKSIRNIEFAMGDGVKRVTETEAPNISVARKSIVAAINIKKGEVFTIHNLTSKRPGIGISPMLWDNVIGKIAKQDFDKDDLIEI
jgi:N,N'-diacetyllegionaminate synthase